MTLLARGALNAAMWNRQREAEDARRKLDEVEHDVPVAETNVELWIKRTVGYVP